MKPPHLLIIGYVNTLRSDDGVGPRLVESVGTLRLPGVRPLICQRLSPEHSGFVSLADAVIFVDAAVDEPHMVQLRELQPGPAAQLFAHAADPRTLLAFARDGFGHAPRAWWQTIPAVNLEFGEQLSPVTEAGYHEALMRIKELAEAFGAAKGHESMAVANAEQSTNDPLREHPLHPEMYPPEPASCLLKLTRALVRGNHQPQLPAQWRESRCRSSCPL